MYRPLALRRRALLVGLLLGTLALLPSCRSSRQEKTYTRLTGEVFHTYFSIQYDLEEDYQREVDSTFHVFSQSLNPFDSTSLITAINRNRSTHTDTMLREVFLQAMEISRHSQGSYDVTCAPLINLWGFGFEKVDSVSPRAIDSILSFVGYQRVRLEGEEMIKEDPRMKMDFSSISKGYCSDLVGRMLASRGARNYLVELGGEIAYCGGNPSGEPWIIGIDKPIDDPSGQVNDLQLRLQLPREAGGLATSGNYRNYRVVNGVKLAHTIDPRTGYPLQTDVLSATILAPTCMLADGLATACMTRQSSEVPALLAHFPGVEYMLILGDGHSGFRTVMSPGFKRLVLPDK
jgi:thiamine biosynthesis lipoprotein apbE